MIRSLGHSLSPTTSIHKIRTLRKKHHCNALLFSFTILKKETPLRTILVFIGSFFNIVNNIEGVLNLQKKTMEGMNPAILKLLGGKKRETKRTEAEINEALVLIPKSQR